VLLSIAAVVPDPSPSATTAQEEQVWWPTIFLMPRALLCECSNIWSMRRVRWMIGKVIDLSSSIVYASISFFRLVLHVCM
jgi:hypothetical protein